MVISTLHKPTPVFCRHYGACGGCDFQDQEYAAQLEYKSTYCRNLFTSFGCVPDPIIASPQHKFFRNKMEFSVGGTPEAPAIGQRRSGQFDQLVDLAECPVFNVHTAELLSIVREWLVENGIAPYDLKLRTGEVRYVSLRDSKAQGELMVTLIAALKPDELARQARYRGLFERLSARLPVSSLFLGCNKERSDTAFSGEPRLMSGSGYIRETVNKIEYIIRPRTFFQTNSACCEKLYDVLRHCAVGLEGHIYDVYCGSGGITLQLAAVGRRVTGIDISERNIEDAKQNRDLNGLSADFLCSDADTFIQGLHNDEPWSLVVDPPRSGLSGKFISILLKNGPKEFIYVSCNPLKLRDDLKKLGEAYTVTRLSPVDMFPHTRHMEVVCVLKRLPPVKAL